MILRLSFGVYLGSGYTPPWTRVYPEVWVYPGSRPEPGCPQEHKLHKSMGADTKKVYTQKPPQERLSRTNMNNSSRKLSRKKLLEERMPCGRMLRKPARPRLLDRRSPGENSKAVLHINSGNCEKTWVGRNISKQRYTHKQNVTAFPSHAAHTTKNKRIKPPRRTK